MNVSKKGEQFKVKLITPELRNSFFDENKIYTCFKIEKFDTCDDEVYIDDINWISSEFTEVV